MDTDRARSAVFFSAYFLLLVYGLVWVQFGYVRVRVGDSMNLFYVLDGVALCYVCLRGMSYLSLPCGMPHTRRASRRRIS